jgi:hypothetical protein
MSHSGLNTNSLNHMGWLVPENGSELQVGSLTGSGNITAIDQVSTYGATYSILNVTLEANRYTVDAAGAPVRDRVVVAHLRMSVPAALSLKNAIEAALLLAKSTGPKSP